MGCRNSPLTLNLIYENWKNYGITFSKICILIIDLLVVKLSSPIPFFNGQMVPTLARINLQMHLTLFC